MRPFNIFLRNILPCNEILSAKIPSVTFYICSSYKLAPKNKFNCRNVNRPRALNALIALNDYRNFKAKATDAQVKANYLGDGHSLST